MAYMRGLLSPTERKNGGPLADVSGDTTPYAFQHLRRRARWDPEVVRDALRPDIVLHLAAPRAVLGLDETGFRKKGRPSAGVARQYRGTAGQVDHCQIGVCLGYASLLGQALLDRELYRHKAWTNDRDRCRRAGIPADKDFATKPQLAQQLLARAFTGGPYSMGYRGQCVWRRSALAGGAGGPCFYQGAARERKQDGHLWGGPRHLLGLPWRDKAGAIIFGSCGE
jgi:DDE superfamily endonuclease